MILERKKIKKLKIIIVIHFKQGRLIMMMFAIAGTISVFATIVIFPWIFNRKIIPNIEKRVGQRLEFTLFTYALLPGMYTFMRYGEIVWYIVIKHMAVKMGYDQTKLVAWGSALQNINYDVRNASHCELIMSYLAVLNLLMTAISFVYY